MTNKFKLIAFFICFIFIEHQLKAEDEVNHSVSGEKVDDILGRTILDKEKSEEENPFVFDRLKSRKYNVENSESNDETDVHFQKNLPIVEEEKSTKRKIENMSQKLGGEIGNSSHYLEINKAEFVKEFQAQSKHALSFSYISNGYNYESPNDVIERTIGTGYKHVKAGMLSFRSDQYFNESQFFHIFWSLGVGVGFSSGRATFINGNKSETNLKFWEIPADLGVGLDFSAYDWLKITATSGPSLMGLIQSRDDLLESEKGSNKRQVSPGLFVSTKLEFNISKYSDDMAYELYTSSSVTNMFFNVEARYHTYRNFLDPIGISGTSLGIGFTFEYL